MRDMKNGGAHPQRRRKFRKKDEDEGALERQINTKNTTGTAKKCA